MSEQINQCDGCRRRLPLQNGVHFNPGHEWDSMVCTAQNYAAPAPSAPAGEQPSGPEVVAEKYRGDAGRAGPGVQGESVNESSRPIVSIPGSLPKPPWAELIVSPFTDTPDGGAQGTLTGRREDGSEERVQLTISAEQRGLRPLFRLYDLLEAKLIDAKARLDQLYERVQPRLE